MLVEHSRYFKKKFKLLNHKVRNQFYKRVGLFLKNRRHPLLRDHPLKGGTIGERSFSITGDIRVIYRFISKSHIRLMNIGTHNQVY